MTIRQPWASLIVAGHKTVENRTWTTNYRGPLVIHAGLAYGTPDAWQHAALVCKAEGIIVDLEPAALPRGAVIGVVDLTGIVQRLDDPWTMDTPYQWTLANARALPAPVACKGAQGLWIPDDRVQAQIEVVERT